jgi:hypothetical protein
MTLTKYLLSPCTCTSVIFSGWMHEWQYFCSLRRSKNSSNREKMCTSCWSVNSKPLVYLSVYSDICPAAKCIVRRSSSKWSGNIDSSLNSCCFSFV